jgi:hypothetical protein
LNACRDEKCVCHFDDKRTTYKFLHLGYYCPTLLEMSRSILEVVTVVSGWEDMCKKIKFLYNPRYLYNHLKNGP